MINSVDREQIEGYVRKIIKYIGDNPAREGLLNTPGRFVRMYEEIFRGYKGLPPKVTWFKRDRPGGLILDKGYFHSMCEHHMIPFFGDYYFGYIPNKREIGASKIGRTIDYYAAKLQTAENLTYEVLERIEQEIRPLGSILLMSGRHFCKEMRGLKKHNSPFEVIEARGILLKNSDGCKDEFLMRIGMRI
jgi:GTP cyclohydrolase I